MLYAHLQISQTKEIFTQYSINIWILDKYTWDWAMGVHDIIGRWKNIFVGLTFSSLFCDNKRIVPASRALKKLDVMNLSSWQEARTRCSVLRIGRQAAATDSCFVDSQKPTDCDGPATSCVRNFETLPHHWCAHHEKKHRACASKVVPHWWW